MDRVFPGAGWQVRSPEEVGLDPDRLASVEAWARSFGEPFRVVWRGTATWPWSGSRESSPPGS